MAVNQLAGIGSNNSNPPPAARAGATEAGSERNLFMTLLVAQLKNQDPLQPQDGTAFVAQLAQFNSLDQLVGIRQSIETLASTLTKRDTPTPTTPTVNTEE